MPLRRGAMALRRGVMALRRDVMALRRGGAALRAVEKALRGGRILLLQGVGDGRKMRVASQPLFDFSQ